MREAQAKRWVNNDFVYTIFVKKDGRIAVYREADPALGFTEGGGLLNKEQEAKFKELINYSEGGYARNV